MSGKDTAGDKLIASIQKTKARTASGADATAADTDKPAEVKPTAKPATNKKATAGKTATKKAASRKADKSKAPTAQRSAQSDRPGKKQLIGLFNRGRRVWPD